MDVEFTVDVISGKRAPGPRVESSTHIMAMGLADSLDDAFRSATGNMAHSCGLTPSEVAQVIGTWAESAEYKVSEVADRDPEQYVGHRHRNVGKQNRGSSSIAEDGCGP